MVWAELKATETIVPSGPVKVSHSGLSRDYW